MEPRDLTQVFNQDFSSSEDELKHLEHKEKDDLLKSPSDLEIDLKSQNDLDLEIDLELDLKNQVNNHLETDDQKIDLENNVETEIDENKKDVIQSKK